MFVNRVISTTANIAANVSIETRRNVFFELNSVFSTLDSYYLNINKDLTDNVTLSENLNYNLSKILDTDQTTISDEVSLNVNLVLSDSVTLDDSISLNLNKVLQDNASITDSLSTYFLFFVNASDSVNTADAAYITFSTPVNDTVSLSDSTVIAVQLATIEDSITASDSNVLLNTQTVYTDSTNMLESLALSTSKFIDDTDSTVTFAELGSGVLLNYTDAIGASGYFDEIYVGETVFTIS